DKLAAKIHRCGKRIIDGIVSREKRVVAIWWRIAQAGNIVVTSTVAEKLNAGRLIQVVAVDGSVEVITGGRSCMQLGVHDPKPPGIRRDAPVKNIIHRRCADFL